MRGLLYVDRDPSLLPVTVRIYLVTCIFFVCYIALLSNSDFNHKLSACGLIFGIFGAGTLYWETIIGGKSLESVSNEIARSSNKALSFSETGMVITFCYFGMFQFLVFFGLILAKYRTGPHGLQITKSIGLDLTFSVLPAISVYSFMKIFRHACARWFRVFQGSATKDREEQTKRLLRTSGFFSLLLSGVMQLPASLS